MEARLWYRQRSSYESWVHGFAFGVVRILIGFARIRSVCESVLVRVRIANQFAGEAIAGRFAQYQEALRILVGFARIRSICDTLRIAN